MKSDTFLSINTGKGGLKCQFFFKLQKCPEYGLLIQKADIKNKLYVVSGIRATGQIPDTELFLKKIVLVT